MRSWWRAEISAHWGTNSKYRTGRLRDNSRKTDARRRDPPAWLIILWNSWFQYALSSGSVAAANDSLMRRSCTSCSALSAVAARLPAKPAMRPKIR
jgi:hypothetical protein